LGVKVSEKVSEKELEHYRPFVAAKRFLANGSSKAAAANIEPVGQLIALQTRPTL
jgi:hypothetical protein